MYLFCSTPMCTIITILWWSEQGTLHAAVAQLQGILIYIYIVGTARWYRHEHWHAIWTIKEEREDTTQTSFVFTVFGVWVCVSVCVVYCYGSRKRIDLTKKRNRDRTQRQKHGLSTTQVIPYHNELPLRLYSDVNIMSTYFVVLIMSLFVHL